MAILVSNKNIAHKAIPLASRCHLLHWVDLHHFVLQCAWSEKYIDDLIFLNWQRVKVNVLDRLDLAIFHETSKLRARNPLLLFRALTLALTFALSFFALALVSKATTFAKATFTHSLNCKVDTIERGATE